MKIDKKIKAAYKALPTPKAEDVLPAAAFRKEKRERRLYRPVIYAVATICLCAVIGVAFMMNSPGNVPVVDGTGEGGENIDTTTAKNVIGVSFEPPLWIQTNYWNAVIKITGLFMEDTIEEYDEKTGETLVLERKFYSFEFIYLPEDSLRDDTDLVVFERRINGGTDNKIEVEKSDVLLVRWGSGLKFKGANCLCIRVNRFDDPGYFKFENGIVEITEEDFANAYSFDSTLFFINAVNYSITYRDRDGVIDELYPEYGDPTPSFPTKKIIGKVTIEEVVEVFEAVEKSVDEWWAWSKTARNIRF